MTRRSTDSSLAVGRKWGMFRRVVIEDSRSSFTAGWFMDQIETFRHGVKGLRNRLCAVITAKSAPKVLGKLASLAKDGVGHHLVELAIYGDVLRLVAVAMSADSTLTHEERSKLGPFLGDVLRRFSRYRRDYEPFVSAKGVDFIGALRHYLADTKVFGFECRPTRMAGLAICCNADEPGGQGGFEDEYRGLLTGLVDAIAHASSGSAVENLLLQQLSADRDALSNEVSPVIVSQLPDLVKLRISCESELFDEVMAIPAVKEMAGTFDAVRKLSEARCAMLRDGVRVSPRILPKVMGTIKKLRHVIGDDVPCEAYVFSQPAINAFVTLQDDVAIIGLSSAAVQQLTGPGELEFVLGHELGHVLFGHVTLGAGPLLKSGRLSVRQAMRVRAWERAAEISADRIGLHVCGLLQNAVAAFFKLQAGVSLDEHSFDLDEFSGQWDELAAELTALGQRDMWDCSHPVSPLRVRAMVMHWEAWNTVGEGREKALETADEAIRRMLAMMDPSDICDQTAGSDTMLAPFYFWGGLYVAMADEGLTDSERKRLLELAPPGFDTDEPFATVKSRPEACMERFREDLGGRRRKLSALELYRIMSGVLDVACADGTLSDLERVRVREVGATIGLREMACDLVVERYLSEGRAAT
jgi:hypothetical protein